MNQTLDNFGCLNNTIKVAAGHYVDLVNPDPSTIDIVSIASALSKICRFGGHCPIFYSVAEHCVHAARMAEDDGCSWDSTRAVLMHDAAEAYLGDMVKPLKVTLPQFGEAERRIENAIATAFGLDFQIFEEFIKRYDRIMLKTEKMEMWPEDQEKWVGFGDVEARPIRIMFWKPHLAESKFLELAMQYGLYRE